MSDFRYMKPGRGPRSTWFFVYNIPSDLRGHSLFMTSRGKPMTKITESLGTKDPDKAREARDQRLVYWNRQFRLLREGPSESDIQEEAVEVYRAALKDGARLWRDAHLKFREACYAELLDNEIALHAEREIRDYCARAGVAWEPGTEPYRKIGLLFLKAKIAAGAPEISLPLPDGRTLRSEYQDLPKVEPPPTAAASPSPLPAPLPSRREAETFSQAFDAYLRIELDGTKAETIADYRRKAKVFIDKIGDLPLTKITDHMVVSFLDDYLLGERKQKPLTRNGYATLFAAVYKCAIRRKKATANPFADQRIKVARVHYEPFTDSELAALFADAKPEISPAEHDTTTALPWAALIGAYSGARLEEIARLKAADIKETEGACYFEIAADGNSKTKAATRVVPVHRKLLDAGLLRYRDALPKDSMLFPSLKSKSSKPGKLGPKLGDAFNSWRKRLGIVRPGVNFHSFRHTVGDRLRKAGVPEDDRAALLGHEDERITSKVYGHDGPGLHRLQGIVGKIAY
jgi:integrase